jgi:hypothetical protein
MMMMMMMMMSLGSSRKMKMMKMMMMSLGSSRKMKMMTRRMSIGVAYHYHCLLSYLPMHYHPLLRRRHHHHHHHRRRRRRQRVWRKKVKQKAYQQNHLGKQSVCKTKSNNANISYRS